MLEKLRQNPERIPSPSRDEMMKMFDALWAKVCVEVSFKKRYDNLKF